MLPIHRNAYMRHTILKLFCCKTLCYYYALLTRCGVVDKAVRQKYNCVRT